MESSATPQTVKILTGTLGTLHTIFTGVNSGHSIISPLTWEEVHYIHISVLQCDTDMYDFQLLKPPYSYCLYQHMHK